MSRRVLSLIGIMLLAASLLPADFSYKETSTITGGAAAAALKVVGVFSKQAREPNQGSVAIKGDKMLHRTANSATVIDLGSQTITTIDMQKKTWSVMTFEEMKQMMDQMAQKMKEKNADKPQTEFKVSSNSTGNTKQIAGMEAKEFVFRMEMESTDQQSGQKGSIVITTHEWIAPAVPGYDQVRDFQRRMAEKLAWTPGSSMMNRPDAAKGMAEIYREMAKMDGMPIFETIVMGMEGQPGAAPADTTSQPPAAQQQQQPPPEKPSIGGMLGGKFGLGRKKPPANDQASSQGSQPPPSGTPGSLLEMQVERTEFSSGAVDESQFAVPAGFKKVESAMKRGMK